MQSENNQELSALQVQVLNELGIDLWVSRANSASEPRVIAERNHHGLPKVVSAVVAEVVSEVDSVELAAAPQKGVFTQAVEFNLVCMRNSHLLLVAQTNGESDESLLGSLIRVSDTRIQGEKFAFKWPQLDTNSGIDAARKAFLAFTSVQASNLESPVLIIFGSEAIALLKENFPESATGLPPELALFDWNGFSCIAVPELESLRVHWQLKRDLCLQLVKLRPEMFKLQSHNSQSKPV